MSEYQYYEFLAVDRPLTDREMRELRALSTRARITPTGFVNVYNWGDFKGDPRRLMERYFDAFLYLANWGTRELMVRLPRGVVDPGAPAPYCAGESFSTWATKEHVVLDFASEVEPEGWEEGEGRLSPLVPLRAELIAGDARCLYLGWLLCAQRGEIDDDEREPPVPPGLGSLTGSLNALAEFLGLEAGLIEAAAEKSAGQDEDAFSREALAAWIASLPASEKDAMLVDLAEGRRPHLGPELLCKYRREGSLSRPAAQGGRTVGELLASAAARAQEKRRRAAEIEAKKRERAAREEAEARRKRLDRLASREPAAWTRVEALVGTRTPKGYGEAVALLADLRDLAARSGREGEFAGRLADIRSRHAKKGNFLRGLDAAGLGGAGPAPEARSRS